MNLAESLIVSNENYGNHRAPMQEHPQFEKNRRSAKIRIPQRARLIFKQLYFESNESNDSAQIFYS
jgi:hypothetical protein